MAHIFIDPSALLKQYIREEGSESIRGLIASPTTETIFVAEIAFPSQPRQRTALKRDPQDRKASPVSLHIRDDDARLPSKGRDEGRKGPGFDELAEAPGGQPP